MKRIALLSVLFFVLVHSCTEISEQSISKEIIIAGKVINYDTNSGKNILTIYINDNGRATQLSVPTRIDSVGNFLVKLERYYPQDVMISYRTNFRVLVHPGDSLYVEFDGKTRQRTKIFETVKYSGDAATINTKLSKYLKTYFETRPSSALIRHNEKQLNPDEYKSFQDSIRNAREIHRDQFILDNEPNNELVNWINTDIRLSYFDNLLSYPSSHSRSNELPRDWYIGDEYYNFIDSIQPVTNKTLVFADTRWFINQYLNSYIWTIAWKNADSKSKANYDSLIIHQILELSPDEGLLKQLALNEYINSRFSKYEVSLYEENVELINESITENFLIEPIHQHYKEIRAYLDRPVLANEIEINGISDNTAAELWSKILSENKGKVIYLDCWATWCGACIAEFPNSNKMMEELKNRDVEFVYLCFKSEEKQWKAVLAEKQMKGKHYFLNDEQSAYFQQLLEISGYPTYAIIDKEGHIVRKGGAFRPSREGTDKIIKELLMTEIV